MAKNKKYKTTPEMASIKRVLEDQEKVLDAQLTIVHGAAIIYFAECLKWDKEQIMKVANEASDVWAKCASLNNALSMLELCEAETEIEMSLDGEKSYHEYPYLDHTKWKKNPTTDERIYILYREMAWIPVMILSCLCIALHRVENWDFDKLSEFVNDINQIRKEKKNPKYYRKICISKYGIPPVVYSRKEK